MDAPLCPLCKTKHWMRDPHQWKDVDTDSTVANKVTNKVTNKVANEPLTAMERIASLEAEVKHLKALLAHKVSGVEVTKPAKRKGDPEKYKARQREYMAKKRAKAQTPGG